MPDVKLALRGLRGESFSDVARRVGSFGGLPVPSDATDSDVLDLMEDRVAELVAAGGFSLIAPVRAATTANITLSGAQTIDGVAVVATNRVLVKNQTAPAENGIYVAAAGAWSRASDFNETSEVVKGAYAIVNEGATQQSSAWVMSTAGTITVGTTAQTWILFRDYSAANVNFLQQGTGAVARAIQPFLRELAVPITSYLWPGESVLVDAGPAWRRAYSSGRPLRLPCDIVVAHDPASEFSPGLFKYCLSPPDNFVLFNEGHFEIKAADGIASWTRVFEIGAFGGRRNVRIYGGLRVNGNSENISASNNEHMHGVFMYNAIDCFIEGIHSTNCRGDDVFIGGDNNTEGSRNVEIVSLYAEKGGRKNLVLGSCLGVHIHSAWLNNLEGGARVYGGTPDSTDGNCFDLEPDSFTGTVSNHAKIDRMITFGAGNDLFSGVTEVKSDAWDLVVSDFIVNITPRAGVPAWNQPGATIRGDRLTVRGMTGVDAQSIIEHGARLDYGELIFEGTRTGEPILLVQAVEENGVINRPRVRIGKATISNTAGNALENRDGEVHITDYYPKTPRLAFWNRGLSSEDGIYAHLRIDYLHLENVGKWDSEGYAALTSTAGNLPILNIGTVFYADNRGLTALGSMIHVGAGASGGTHLRQVVTETMVEPVSWDDTRGWYRSGARNYVCKGDPDLTILDGGAGALAQRVEGGLYRQTAAGAGNWVSV